MIILHILLFILCLSILVVIHELGHLAAAKIFKVYCFEFSVGFGPAFFRKKRKKGETYVAFRSIPFGGYVSMYGEGETGEDAKLPDGIESIPANRSLVNIKKWKKAIIMGAGVFLNAVLAFVLFFVSNTCFEQQKLILTGLQIQDDSPAASAGIVVEQGDIPEILFYGWDNIENNDTLSEEAKIAQKSNYCIVSKEATFTYEGGTSLDVAVILDIQKATFKNRDYTDLFRFFEVNDENTILYAKEIVLKSESEIINLTFVLNTCQYVERVATDIKSHNITLNIIKDGDSISLEKSGICMYLDAYWNNFGQAMNQTVEDFGTSSVMIFEALGGLFVGKNWDSVGGPIAIFTQSTSTLENFGVAYFIELWAIISVNLAIFNLIPFPGLDGWHLLVVAIEGITRKKVPEKAKNIASYVGMILLFGLMFLIVIKDIIGLF